MVSISAVRENNSNIDRLYGPGLVAVFVGGTNGIGESTARAFVHNTTSATIYLIGRDETRASQLVAEFRSLNPDGKVEFIKCDASLLREVDRVCRTIQQKEKQINLLFMSQGVMTTKGRDETDEGLDKKFSLHYYSRIRFLANLLPQLSQAGESHSTTATGDGKDAPQRLGLSRVVSVLAPGRDGALNLEDLSLKNHYSLSTCAVHSVTMTSAAMEELASSHPEISFLHTYPGLVRTGLLRNLGTITGFLAHTFMFLSRPWEVPFAESGERHLYASTAPGFCPRAGKDGTENPAEGSDGSPGTGFYRLAADCSTYQSSQIMQQYRADGTRSLIWKHTVDLSAEITGREDGGR